MATVNKSILWVDDEIDSLKPHILFLENKGYTVRGVVSGDDALEVIQNESFDLVLLDEMMPGKDGLATLEGIKEIRPHLPVVMVTKSEEESLMDEAIGQKIDDYLVKPVVPSQVLMVIKKLLESKRIIGSSSMKRYISEINRFNNKLFGPVEPVDWHEAAKTIASWNLELDDTKDSGLQETHEGTKKEWNTEFTKFIDREYLHWLSSDDRPLLSPDIVKQFVVPPLKRKEKVAFIVVDCLRLDQWLLIEPLIAELYNVERDCYFSILPTATPFARNAIFAGMFPDDIHESYPDNYTHGDEGSLNRIEGRLLNDNLAREGVRLNGGSKYIKIHQNHEGDELVRHVSDLYDYQLVTLVFNFLDILVHGRSNNVILKEIAGTEAAFRSLMKSWFIHSPLFAVLRAFSERGFKVVITSDHGSVLCKRGTTAHGRRATSTNLRYKYGDNLNSDPKDSIQIRNPKEWRLPMLTLATTYIIAKEDFYFVYPNNYNKMVRQFQNSFQHGGVSLEEMVVPLAVLTPR